MLNKLTEVLLFTVLTLLLTSCTFDYLLKESYTHLGTEEYAVSDKLPIYVGTAYSAQAIYDTLFSDFFIIGKSSLTAEHGYTSDYIRYGKKIGSDIVIASFQNMQKTIEYIKTTSPKKEKSVTILERDEKGKQTKSKTIDTYKDEEIYMPFTVTTFDQDVFFLKKIDGAKAPWEYIKKDFTFRYADDTDPYLGNWIGYKTCRIEINSTGDEYLGFVDEVNCKEKTKINKILTWKNGDIKLRINKKSKQGFYLNRDKIPILIESQMNKLGHLELLDKNTGQVIISFQKIRFM